MHMALIYLQFITENIFSYFIRGLLGKMQEETLTAWCLVVDKLTQESGVQDEQLPVSEAVKVKRILGARHCEIERITAD